VLGTAKVKLFKTNNSIASVFWIYAELIHIIYGFPDMCENSTVEYSSVLVPFLNSF